MPINARALILRLVLGAEAHGDAALGVRELLSACALFNHANLALPPRVDAALRRVLITPDVHRTHHSIHRDETDSNYGFSVVWWDRLFGTWRAAPRDGHAAMTLGLDAFRATIIIRNPTPFFAQLKPRLGCKSAFEVTVPWRYGPCGIMP